MSEESRADLSLEELGDRLQTTARELSMAQVAFQSAIAEQLRLSGSDMRCVDFIQRFGPLSASELGELTRLTSGAITGVVDRLERIGFVHRVPDPADRRKILIGADEEVLSKEVHPLYVSISQRYGELTSRYTGEQLALILDFLQESVTLVQEETTRIWGMMGERR